MSIPEHVKYVVIGAGVHGLSSAYHLALELKARRKGSGRDILVVDKSSIAAGASGIACGIIRNNYFQPAMRELMAHSVEVWESDPEAFSYHPVGYMQIQPGSHAAGRSPDPPAAADHRVPVDLRGRHGRKLPLHEEHI